MKTTPLSIVIVLLGLCTPKAMASDMTPEVLDNDSLTSHKECNAIVYENPQSPLKVSTSGNGTSRGFGADLWKAMRSSYTSNATGLIVDMSSDVITSTIGALTETLRNKNGDWQKMVKQDCTFNMTIPMDDPVKDFYGSNSYKGAMDPDGIIFDGFGCRQVMYLSRTSGDSTITSEIPVIDIKCSLRKDSAGIARMLHHGKFEVVLDYVKINPYLCNLPNVVLSEEELQSYIPFDFTRRANFKLSLNAVIKSSWINEAILLSQDQTLGTFKIDISIPDSTYLQYEGNGLGYFVYQRPELFEGTPSQKELDDNKRSASKIKLSGESFIVPRTYIGYDDNQKKYWGTGMYSVEMSLSETCDINRAYYLDQDPRSSRSKRKGKKDKWNHHWSEEWALMKHRQQKDSPYNTVWQNVKMKYGENKWINTVVSPAKTFILNSESDFVKKHLDKWLQFGKESEK